MAQFLKPAETINTVWGTVGERIKPSDEKIQLGWVVEIPPLQYENWSQNRQDQAIAHFNQHGIAVWDRYTQYLGGKSYVQGSDGFIYKAIVDNFNRDPVTDRSAWMSAFISEDNPGSLKVFNGYTIISSDFDVSLNTRYYAINSVTLTLPATAVNGDNVIINKAPTAEVTIVVEGGAQIRTLMGLMNAVIYDVLDEINVVWNGTNWQTS